MRNLVWDATWYAFLWTNFPKFLDNQKICFIAMIATQKYASDTLKLKFEHIIILKLEKIVLPWSNALNKYR